MRNRMLLCLLAISAAVPPSFSQSTPVATTAATVIPALIRYDGVAQPAGQSPALVTFLIFEDEIGGDPLWTETQTVTFDPSGKYEVYLGAANASGLPFAVFNTGEARWLEVQVSGAKPQARVLLASVPYAVKASDAATLGGLPASAFALAGSQVASSATITAPSVTPNASSTVTTSGGSSDYLPKFTGGTTIANSEIYDTGTSVGIGDKPNAGAKLDVNGPMIMRGSMTVSRTGNATSSKGYPSYGFDFYSNAYNSSTKATDNPHFQLQSEPTGNNSSNTGATFNLLYANSGNTPAETGLSINSSGVIKFASGQTFNLNSPDGVAVDGTSTSGTGVEGTSYYATGAAGSSTYGDGMLGYTAGYNDGTGGVVGQASGTSGFTGIAGVWGDSTNHVGVYGTSAQAGGVLGQSTSGVGVQGTSTSSVGVQGSSASGIGVEGTSTTNVAGLFSNSSSAPTVNTTNTTSNGGSALTAVAQGSYGIAVSASETGTDGTGVEAFGNGNGVIGDTSGGVLSTAGVLGIAGSRTGVGGIAGVWGDAQAHVGVIGSSTQYDGVQGVTQSQAGVHGIAGASTTGLSFLGTQPALVGVWGDSTGAGSSFQQIAVLGTANDGVAGEFWNSSDEQPTFFAYNYGSGGADVASPFRTLEASTAYGTCGFGGKGTLTCTGQLKSLATTGNGAHTVETYSMQSPENWMEDFGSGTLKNGIATVTIDAAFADTVSGAADYHVFLTPQGDSKGLFVTNRTASSFEVHESGGGTATIGFDFRIVAKRRGFEAQRIDRCDRSDEGCEGEERSPGRAAQEDCGSSGTSLNLAPPSIQERNH